MAMEGAIPAEVVIDQVVRALVMATVVGSVGSAVAGHIRLIAVATKHKEQATADDDIPQSNGRGRIAWQLLPLQRPPILGGKALIVAVALVQALAIIAVRRVPIPVP